MKDTEILIVGGGPAGLLAASYLAERHHVTLIDRSPLGETTKYWVTTERRLRRNDLSCCLLRTSRTLLVGTYLGTMVRGVGDLVVVDDGLLFREVIDRCRARGVLIAERCSLINLTWTSDRICAQTTGESYRARLVVDATGSSSPIASTFRLHRLHGFFTVFGAHLQSIRLRGPEVVLAYANALGHPPPILEVIPTGETSAYCSVFIFSPLLTSPGSLEGMFHRQCLHNPFFEVSGDTETTQTKMGVIAIGRYHRHLPGVVPIGEAGLIQPPLLGTAFNEVLEYTRLICLQISESLNTAPVAPRRIRIRYPMLKRAQDCLQRGLVRMLLRGNVEAFDWVVSLVRDSAPELVFRLCSNELTWTDLMGIAGRLPMHALLERQRPPASHDVPAP